MPRKPKPIQPTQQPLKLCLAASLDLKAAAPLTDKLLANRGHDIEIDGSQVQRLGAQCLQVLLAARQTWLADGKGFALRSASPAIAATIALLGISPADLHLQTEADA